MSITKAMIGVAAIGVPLFFLGWAFSDDKHGVKWVLGGIGWFGFLICALLLVVLGLLALGRGVHRRATTTA